MINENASSIPVKLLQGMLEGMSDGIVLTDSQEQVTFINQSAVRILGCREQIDGQGQISFHEICSLLNLRTGQRYASPLEQVIHENRVVGLSRNIGILRGPLQELVYLSANCSPLRNMSGESCGCLVILRDVTHLRRLELKVENDHAYMRSVFSAAKVGLCVLNDQGAIVDINDSGLETMEISYKDAIGQQFGDAFRCENSFRSGCGHGHACRQCPIRRNIEAAIRDEHFESEVTAAMHSRRAPEPIWLKVFFSQAESNIGRQIIVAIVDISQRKKREAALDAARRTAEEASQTKSQFLANMSHEIRTPINGMNGMIDLTLRTRLDEEQRENLLSAKQCSEDLLRIINDILDFSKLECGKMELEQLDFDLRRTLRRVCLVHRKVAKGKGLYFRPADYEQLPHYITGDPMRLRQIFHNLLTNAVKFTTDGGITVQGEKRRQGDQAVLWFAVRDTGIGMSFEEQKKLFKPFSQVDGSTTRKFGGTGLGLMIVKDLVESMGGQIEVHSAPHCGSEFAFWMPLREAAGESEESRERTVFINTRWNKQSAGPEASEKKEEDVGDIASLLAYCEQKLDEGDACE